MKIAIIGSGNVATVLGKKIAQAKHQIVQIIGHSESSACFLAKLLMCPYSICLEELTQEADLYLICVQDKEVAKVVSKIKIPPNKTIAHTAGGISIDVFGKEFNYFGVLYPLQTLRKEELELPLTPLFIDANDHKTQETLRLFAQTITSKVALADDQARMQLHVSAVFVSNFTNYMYTLAYEYCEQQQIDFSYLHPLIAETSQRLQHSSPASVQTGPAVRGDIETITKHLELLRANEEMKGVYQFLSEKITQHFPSK